MSNTERSVATNVGDQPEAASEATSISDDPGSSQSQSDSEGVIFNGEPPYLEALPLLDGNLYVKHDSEKFQLGGSNLHLIRYVASTRTNRIPTIEDRQDHIEFATSEQPYIEFSYKGSFYSIRVLTHTYSTRVEIREIRRPTVALNRSFGG